MLLNPIKHSGILFRYVRPLGLGFSSDPNFYVTLHCLGILHSANVLQNFAAPTVINAFATPTLAEGEPSVGDGLSVKEGKGSGRHAIARETERERETPLSLLILQLSNHALARSLLLHFVITLVRVSE